MLFSFLLRKKKKINSFETEQYLKELYYNAATGYSSAQSLYKRAKDEGLDVSMNQVRSWLASQDTYVRFRQPSRNFKRIQTSITNGFG